MLISGGFRTLLTTLYTSENGFSKMQLKSVLGVKQHEKLKSLVIDQPNAIMYTSDCTKRLITAFSLESLKDTGKLKLSNCRATKLCVDSHL